MASDEGWDEEFEELSEDEVALLFEDEGVATPKPEPEDEDPPAPEPEPEPEEEVAPKPEEPLSNFERRLADGHDPAPAPPAEGLDDLEEQVKAYLQAEGRVVDEGDAAPPPTEPGPEQVRVVAGPPTQPAPVYVDMDARIRTLEEANAALVSENRRIIDAIEKMPAFLIQALQTGKIEKYLVPEGQGQEQQAAPQGQPQPQPQPSAMPQQEYDGSPVEITTDVSGATMLASQEMNLPQQAQTAGAAPPANVTPNQFAGMMSAGALGSGTNLDSVSNFMRTAMEFAQILGIGRRKQAQGGMNTQGLQDFMNVMQQFMSLNAGFKNMQAMEMEQTTKHLGRMFRMMGTNLVGMMQNIQPDEEGKDGGEGGSFEAYTVPPQGGAQSQEGGVK